MDKEYDMTEQIIEERRDNYLSWKQAKMINIGEGERLFLLYFIPLL